MGQAKHAPTTPPNHLQPRKRASQPDPARRAALASLFTLSTAAGASAIVVANALLPTQVAARPADPDAAIHAHVAATLPALERYEAMTAERRREGRKDMSPEQRMLFQATERDAEVLAPMRPVTLAGFQAKARIARCHLFLAITIMRDLEALDALPAGA